MKCLQCGKTHDSPGLVCKDCLEKSGYQAKAHLVLEGSETHEWGVVKDCMGSVNYIPEDAEVVGTWSKYGEGTYWVALETSMQALQDRATLLTAELAARRRVELKDIAVKKSRVPKPKEPPKPSVFDDLRKSLGQ